MTTLIVSTGPNGPNSGAPVTRADEAMVRPILARAFEGGAHVRLHYGFDDILKTIEASDDMSLCASEIAALARAGIVPGPEGWYWAAAAGLTISAAEIRHTPACKSAGLPDGDKCECTAVAIDDAGAPPEWFTCAILAALPPSGEPRGFNAIEHAVNLTRGLHLMPYREQTERALDHLVSTGEIEAVPGAGQWRRWGVPEGWGLRHDQAGWSYVVRDEKRLGDQIAAIRGDGHWTIFQNEESCAARIEGEGGQQAALRACYECGVFGPRPAPTVILDTPSRPAGMGEQRAIVAAIAGAPPPEDRPSRLRAALLSVLSRGPVEGLARLLPALDAAMGEAPGVARVTGAEARRAAAEVGAVVDGARWSLSEGPPPGWGWRDHTWGLYLSPLDASSLVDESIANVSLRDSKWTVTERGHNGAEITHGVADNDEDAQGQALAAARRAGLFARPAAVEVTGDGDPPALPAVTAQGGEAVVPQAPLDALLALLSRVSGGPLDHETQTAAGAFVRAVVAAVEALSEIKAMRSPRVTIEGPTLRVYADDGRTVVSEERVGDTFLDDEDDAIPPSSVPFSPLLSACIEIARAVSRGVKAGASDYGALVREALHGVALEDFLDEFKRFDGGRPMRFLGVTGVPHEETRSAERAAAEARLEAEAAERRAAQAERERDKARAELAALREGVDGLRTWAHGVKGASK